MTRHRTRLPTRWWCRASLLGLLCLPGCEHGFFTATGFLASDGGALGTWRSAPLACSRDPFDGAPIGTSTSVATLLWEDPSVHDPWRDEDRPHAPDAPMRLELTRDAGAYRAVLTTVKTLGTPITQDECTRFSLESWEQPPASAKARPSLAGHLLMDCRVHGSHVTADLAFRHCEF